MSIGVIKFLSSIIFALVVLKIILPAREANNEVHKLEDFLYLDSAKKQIKMDEPTKRKEKIIS